MPTGLYRGTHDRRYRQAAGGSTISYTTPISHNSTMLPKWAGTGSGVTMSPEKFTASEQGEVIMTIPGHPTDGQNVVGAALVAPGRLHKDAVVVGIAINTDAPDRPGASSAYVGGVVPVAITGGSVLVGDTAIADDPLQGHVSTRPVASVRAARASEMFALPEFLRGLGMDAMAGEDGARAPAFQAMCGIFNMWMRIGYAIGASGRVIPDDQSIGAFLSTLNVGPVPGITPRGLNRLSAAYMRLAPEDVPNGMLGEAFRLNSNNTSNVLGAAFMNNKKRMIGRVVENCPRYNPGAGGKPHLASVVLQTT